MTNAPRSLRPETLAIHGGSRASLPTGDIMPPIHLSTTFERETDGSYRGGYDYGRSGNPNRDDLEACLASLEQGETAVAVPSGMAATHAVFSALEPGQRVVIPRDTYFGTSTLLHGHFERWGLEVVTVDTTDREAVENAVEGARLLWLETPSNPCIEITDLRHAIAVGHDAGAVVACDNTWATPFLQRPLELGADVVVHSTTKYMAGHSDTMGGAVVFRRADELADRVRAAQTEAGLVPSPFDCWMVRRGLYTLAHRLRGHCDNARRLAAFLEEHPSVERVHYPGLVSDPGHEVAAAQMSDFGGMLSFVVSGERERAFAVANGLHIAQRATSLGGPETLVEHRASIEGEATRAPQGLLRVSVGLEHPDDLVEDFDRALHTS